MSVKMKPILDNVIIELQSSNKTGSGLFVASSNDNNQPVKATVVAVGSGTVLDNGEKLPMQVQVGDVVLVPHHTGSKFAEDGKEYIVISQRNILAVIC